MVEAASITLEDLANEVESAMTSSCQVFGSIEYWTVLHHDGTSSNMVYSGRSDSVIRLTVKSTQD